jgi:hypothetical protein
MTPEELEAIKVRCAQATPGPWGTYHSLNGWHYTKPGSGPVRTTYEQARADVEFIAAARTDVPALVAEVERLRAALSHYAGHKLKCPANWDKPCLCGFDRVLEYTQP